MTEVRTRADWIAPMKQSPVSSDDAGGDRYHIPGIFLVFSTCAAERHPQGIHWIDALGGRRSKSIKRRLRQGSARGEIAPERTDGLGQRSVPQQPDGFFECSVEREIFDGITRNDEFAMHAIHHAERSLGRHDTFESTTHKGQSTRMDQRRQY